MNLARTATGIALLMLLGGGYLASQYAYFFGDAAGYAAQVDTPPIQLLSLVLFILVIVLCCVREPEVVE